MKRKVSTLCTVFAVLTLCMWVSSPALAQNVSQQDFMRSTGEYSGTGSTGGTANSAKKKPKTGTTGLDASGTSKRTSSKRTRKGRK